MSPVVAYSLASQFGSYQRAGDPGACFYAFHADDGRPVSEAHRRQLLEQIAARLRWREGCAYRGASTERRNLRALRRYYSAAPLRPDQPKES